MGYSMTQNSKTETKAAPLADRDKALAAVAALPEGHPDRPTLPALTHRKVWSVTEAMQLLGLSRKSIYDLLKSGDLRSVMIAGRRLIPDGCIDELIATKLAQPMEKSGRGQSRSAA